MYCGQQIGEMSREKMVGFIGVFGNPALTEIFWRLQTSLVWGVLF